MCTNTAFESIAKTTKQNASKFNSAASQEAFKPAIEQLKAWGELAQKQAKGLQAAAAQTVESFKGLNVPQAAFEAMKASAESSIATATQNWKDVTALGFAQVHAGVNAVEKTDPAPEAFATVGKGLKDVASTMGNALESALKTGAAVIKKSGAS